MRNAISVLRGGRTSFGGDVVSAHPGTRAGGRLLVAATILATGLALLLAAPAAQAQEYGFITKWGERGSGAGQFGSGPIVGNGPRGIAIDAAGNVYVADTENSRIQKFTPDGAFIAAWGWGVDTGADEFQICTRATRPCQRGQAARFPPSGDGQFHLPRGVATDSAGNVYVSEHNTWGDRIQKFTPNGDFIAKWGSWGRGHGQFSDPDGVAIDVAGNVYVADRGNHRIQKFTSDGAFDAMWGWGVNTGVLELQTCRPATLPCQQGIAGSGDGQFDWPYDVATDSAGNVYVADRRNQRIQKFTANGAFLAKWGGGGRGAGELGDPWGVATDAAGNVYVAEFANSRIQKFSSNGAFLAMWGVGVDTGVSGGPKPELETCTPATLPCHSGNAVVEDAINPTDVAVDAAGNVYVLDTGNRRVQKFAPRAAPPPSGGPSNQLSLGKVNLNRKRGIARLIARVPGPGRVILRQTKQVRRAARQVESAGRTRLPVRPRGKAQRRISSRRCQRSGKKRLAVRVMVRVTYRPAEGEPQTQQRRVRLVKRC